MPTRPMFDSLFFSFSSEKKAPFVHSPSIFVCAPIQVSIRSQPSKAHTSRHSCPSSQACQRSHINNSNPLSAHPGRPIFTIGPQNDRETSRTPPPTCATQPSPHLGLVMHYSQDSVGRFLSAVDTSSVCSCAKGHFSCSVGRGKGVLWS